MSDRPTLQAISLTDPWATLVVAGIKTLETRKGPVLSGFSGPLVICRTKADCDPYDYTPFTGDLDHLDLKPYADDDRGMAIGVVMVKGTGRLSPIEQAYEPGMEERRRRACFHDIASRYLSVLTAAAWFPRPVAARGAQGRFKVEVPVEFLPEWARGGQSFDETGSTK